MRLGAPRLFVVVLVVIVPLVVVALVAPMVADSSPNAPFTSSADSTTTAAATTSTAVVSSPTSSAVSHADADYGYNDRPHHRQAHTRPSAGFLGAKATDGAAKAFRSFTSTNFRENLARLTGEIPRDAQAHHVFPQQFAGEFERRGINVNDPQYGAWWEGGAHGRAAYRYNRDWRTFLGDNPNRNQILDFGRQQARRYGFEPGF